MKSEHEIFTDFIDSITWAQACAIELGQARPDQPWNNVATKLEELKQGLWRMVGDGAVKGMKQ
jgi:succinylglutamate desuccinylase